MTEQSNIDREITWNSWSTLFKFVLAQWAKSTLHTAMPGIIEVYDPVRRRARVQPALRMMMTNGDAVDRTPLVNVPVLFPSGGGYSFLFPLAQGDPVLLLFNERGIAAFKESFALTNPDVGSFFSLSDAVALPGFGPLQLTPATQTGSTWQTEDGETSIVIEQPNIQINVPDGAQVQIGGPGGQRLATAAFAQDVYAATSVTAADNHLTTKLRGQ